MHFKKSICLVLAAVCALTAQVSASDLFSIKTALPARPEQKQCAVSVATGEILSFSAQDLERRMGIADGGMHGATVTALPPRHQGALVLEGVEVEPYQFLSRAEIDDLCFVPNEAVAAASFTLLPQGHDAVATNVSISVLAEQNKPPVIEDDSYTTAQNTAISGYITASDPSGDTITMQVIQPPAKGQVTFTGQSFVYRPFQDQVGRDSFTLCAVDRFGSYSREATIDVRIEPNRSGFQFVDMTTNPSAYAAIKLHENGVISGEKLGQNWFFHPSRQTTRAELLVMLLSATGLDSNLPATVNTQLPEDASLPLWLKPYVKKAIEQGIWQEGVAFRPNEIPTRAETVHLTALAANINDVKDFDLGIGDRTSIPDWALSSYKELAAYKMLDLYDGNAYPSGPLTKSYCADLMWQLWKHCHR